MFAAPHVRQVGHPAHVPVGHVPVLDLRFLSVCEPRVARLVDVVIRQQNCGWRADKHLRGVSFVVMLNIKVGCVRHILPDILIGACVASRSPHGYDGGSNGGGDGGDDGGLQIPKGAACF